MWKLPAYKLVTFLTPLIPARMGYFICRLIGLSMYLGNARLRRTVDGNLRLVMPRTSWLRRQPWALRVFFTSVMNPYDLVRLRSVDRGSLFERLEIEGRCHLEHALSLDKGAILFSPHLGNIDVAAQVPSAWDMRSAIVAERAEPPELDRYVTRLRTATGMSVIPPERESIPRMLQLLRNNGVLLFACDRDITGHGAPVKLFCRETLLPRGPVVLSMRTGAPLVPIRVLRVNDRCSRVVIGEPLELCRTGMHRADVNRNLQQLAITLEQLILTDPGQWVMLQPIWPDSGQP